LTGLNLQFFDTHSNQLSGPFPSLAGLFFLTDFNVHSNQLSGPIPALTGMSLLENFDIGANRLTGAMPAAPSPNSLLPGQSKLCLNPLDTTPQPPIDPAWNGATGHTPWWQTPFVNNLCDDLF